VKELELKLISALMKNSHRSDRELSKTLDVSQPTVTRIRHRLEEQGYIKEYTTIPDFGKIGFQIMSFILIKLKKEDPEVEMKIREQLRENLKKKPFATFFTLSGLGARADRIAVAFHQNYSEYVDYIAMMKQHPLVSIEETTSFLVNLADSHHFQLMTFSEIADYVATMRRE
jgi:DNA-binding Lrp family transcriptional regulator